MKLIWQQRHPLYKSVIQSVYKVKKNVGASILKYYRNGEGEIYDLAIIKIKNNNLEFLEDEDRYNLNFEEVDKILHYIEEQTWK